MIEQMDRSMALELQLRTLMSVWPGLQKHLHGLLDVGLYVGTSK